MLKLFVFATIPSRMLARGNVYGQSENRRVVVFAEPGFPFSGKDLIPFLAFASYS
jgi:hypothetical protein